VPERARPRRQQGLPEEVEPSELKNHGDGETKPLCTQNNEDCWSKNRRVEFIILRRTDEAQLQGGEGQ